MKITDYHAKYFAYELTKRCSSDSLEKLSSTLSNAQVDLNPHQIEAALFAFKSPLSRGAILADEVGLGKTIEAGLVLSQKWAERKRKILLIVPSSLRKQWNSELQEKFFLPSIILEAKSFNQSVKDGNLNPFNQGNAIVICSYHFAKAKSPYIKQIPFDLVVIDEAHRLRNVYKTSNKIAREIKNAIQEYPKLLLTATPLQNSLLELYGLVSIIDDHVFGDLNSFKANYSRVNRQQDVYESEPGLVEPKQEMFADLRNRLKPICIRTLRRQVLEYINYRDRKAITQNYIPTEQEIELYDGMTEYLQRPLLYALPSSQRQLMTLILRKLLASSSFAIASTLNGLVYKLEKLEEEIKKGAAIANGDIPQGFEENYEAFSDTADEWIDDEEDDNDNEEEKGKKKYSVKDIPLIELEKTDLEEFRDWAKAIFKNSKGESLLIALGKGFEKQVELAKEQGDQDIPRKAIIFTESKITQEYLWKLLSDSGYKDKILLFNGSNNDQKSKEIYAEWLSKNKDSDKISGSKTADLRAALVDYFKSDAEIMIATEAAAEGINLQFCSLVINYDLPWNPQRIEQRIGRCHRYGQKHDVVVVNFVNLKNAADRRVYDLLDQKFNLFKGVFGASDEVLGSIESGVDFEKRIAAIYQSCRTEEEINIAFDSLQTEMDVSIQEGMKGAKEKLLENFDTDVHEKLKINLRESKAYLETYEKWLWDVSQYFLGDKAVCADNEYSFTLRENPFPGGNIEEGPYKIGKNVDDAHIYRPGHPLAERILREVKAQKLPNAEIVFDYSNFGQIISPVKELVGKKGVMKASVFTIDSFEKEDYILVSAMTDTGEIIEEDVAKKLFSLKAKVSEKDVDISSESLDKAEKKKISVITSTIAERNSEFFDVEIVKLDSWSEDKRCSLKLELKEFDDEITILKKEARQSVNLPEKLAIQKKLRDIGEKRDVAWKKYDESAKEIEKKKDVFLDTVEKRLKQKTNIETLFTIRWKII